MKYNSYIKKGRPAAAAVLAAAALCGCGYQPSAEAQEKPVIDAGNVFENASTEPVQELQEYSGIPAQEESPETEASKLPEAEDKFWYDKYRAILEDWTLAEGYGDFSYLPMYFGEDYAFDSYWLCDVDKNGVPELFLHSSTMAVITAAFTCTQERPVFLTYDDFYGINQETGELVIHGHWHGAGGSYDNEWSAYKVLPDRTEYSMYIDFFDFSADGQENVYTVYNPQTGEYGNPPDGTEYEALYAAHVQPCVTVENYTLYELSDLSGLDTIQ